jgi:dienelactone hydrolase
MVGQMKRPPYFRLLRFSVTPERFSHPGRHLAFERIGRVAVIGLVVAAGVGIMDAGAAPSSPSALAVGSPIKVAGPGGEGRFAVGYHVETLIDHTRPTPANGAVAAETSRTLETFVFYPASGRASRSGVGGTGVRPGATPQRRDGPFPLIVFAHGFGTDPTLSEYSSLLEQWASAGFVVAAPLFPLTRGDAPGGPDLDDYVNQPGDMAFVARQMVAQSKTRKGFLSQMVNPHEIGAAGHSLGGVTTLGLVANSCCRDSRIRAAVVMSGDPIKFPTGAVDYTAAPPLLLIHGNADQAVPYVSSIDAFNGAAAPKGLLTVVGGNHDSPVTPTEKAFPSVVRTTIDFFDRYLKGERAAVSRLVDKGSPALDAQRRVTTLTFVAQPATRAKLPVPPTVTRTLHATVTPTQGLTDGQVLTVSWEGFAPGVSINILQCSVPQPAMASDCNLRTATLLHADPQGSGSLPFAVHTGLSGSGLCDATHPQCVVVINQGGSLSAAATVATPISFAS